jgi:hypothetical protein
MTDMGWPILSFLIFAAIVAALAVALDIWLGLTSVRHRYDDRRTNERTPFRMASSTPRLPVRAWLFIICAIAGMAALFTIAKSTIATVETEHSQMG